MMTARIATLIGALSLTAPVLAEEAMLGAPMAGASAHVHDVSISAYWKKTDSGFGVVAFVAQDGSSDEPLRLQMTLHDGDAVQFGLPGFPGKTFSFAREGYVVRVSADWSNRLLAMN